MPAGRSQLENTKCREDRGAMGGAGEDGGMTESVCVWRGQRRTAGHGEMEGGKSK